MSNKFNTRLDGRIEWVCDHGIGHTIKGYATHGCDGCCGFINRTELQEVFDNPQHKYYNDVESYINSVLGK